LKLAREGEVLGNAIKVGGMHSGGLAEAAQAMGIFGLGQVAASGAMAQSLASGSDFEPFGHGLFRFDAFGTSHKLIQKRAYYTCPLQRSKGK
jgi:hypothetical protein